MQTGASKARLKYHYPIYTETPLIIPQGKFARCHHCGGNVFTTMLPDNMGGWESRCIQCGRAYNSEGDEVANYKIRAEGEGRDKKMARKAWRFVGVWGILLILGFASYLLFFFKHWGNFALGYVVGAIVTGSGMIWIISKDNTKKEKPPDSCSSIPTERR